VWVRDPTENDGEESVEIWGEELIFSLSAFSHKRITPTLTAANFFGRRGGEDLFLSFF